MQSDDAPWAGVRGEAKTQQQVSEKKKYLGAQPHGSKRPEFHRQVKADKFPPPFNTQRQTAAIHPRVLPVSAAGYSESCCPVIRCRQTCWELWRLAWSMLE